jgi:hypothetical protein
MASVYCVMREDIVQMSYPIEVLDRVFATKELAQAYINSKVDRSRYSIEEMELDESEYEAY